MLTGTVTLTIVANPGVEQKTLRKHLDLDATYRVVERLTGPEITLGYGAIAAVEVDGEFEQCVRLSVRSADQHDVPPSVAAIRSMLAEASRTGVEGFFSRLKNAQGVDFATNLKVRGIIKVTLMTALAAVATNLRLRFNRDYENGWRGPDE